ncbi:MAG TPA: hypothetical protein VGJ72_09050 [Polaromonas sp.]
MASLGSAFFATILIAAYARIYWVNALFNALKTPPAPKDGLSKPLERARGPCRTHFWPFSSIKNANNPISLCAGSYKFNSALG